MKNYFSPMDFTRNTDLVVRTNENEKEKKMCRHDCLIYHRALAPSTEGADTLHFLETFPMKLMIVKMDLDPYSSSVLQTSCLSPVGHSDLNIFLLDYFLGSNKG